LPTYFVFTPTMTTEEYREELRSYPEYNKPVDSDDPESPLLWEEFNYELACAELCGRSHYSMRRIVRIVSQEEYDAWLEKQQSFYISSIRGKLSDPHRGILLDVEKNQNRDDLNTSIESALGLNMVAGDTTLAAAAADPSASTAAPSASDRRTIQLQYVLFDRGSSRLTEDSKFQLTDLAEILKKYPQIRIEIATHTANTGNEATNKTLSQQRSDAAKAYLVSQGIESSRVVATGYGSSQPLDTTNTDAARQKNARTEIRIIAQ